MMRQRFRYSMSQKRPTACFMHAVGQFKGRDGASTIYCSTEGMEAHIEPR